jgi:hypothetical protein
MSQSSYLENLEHCFLPVLQSRSVLWTGQAQKDPEPTPYHAVGEGSRGLPHFPHPSLPASVTPTLTKHCLATGLYELAKCSLSMEALSPFFGEHTLYKQL